MTILLRAGVLLGIVFTAACGSTGAPPELDGEERLVVQVAVSTCFLYSVDSTETPIEDVRTYVSHLIDLHQSNPLAPTNASEGMPRDVRSSLEFCVDRLESSAPEEATRLRDALEGN